MTKGSSSRLDMTMMLAIHDALRRELRHIAQITADTSDGPDPLLRNTPGWQMFRSYLHVHHSCEDDLLWPIMTSELSGQEGALAVVGAMAAEHDELDPLLRGIDAAFTDGDEKSRSLEALVSDLTNALTAHLNHEEADCLGLIDATITEQQWEQFGNEHGKRLRSEAPRYLPWLLDGVESDRADRILNNIPEPLRLAFRDEWQPAFAGFDRWAVTDGAVGE